MTLNAWLTGAGARYTRRARTLAEVTRELGEFRVYAFTICTPMQTYESALAQWRRWERTGVMAGAFGMRRQAWVHEVKVGELRRRENETVSDWAKRMEGMPGMGKVKAPFFTSLMEPLGDGPTCVDRWVMRGLEIEPARESETGEGQWTRTQVMQARRRIALRAGVRGMAPFVYQWCAWDWWRSRGEEYAEPMLVRETNIGEDLRP